MATRIGIVAALVAVSPLWAEVRIAPSIAMDPNIAWNGQEFAIVFDQGVSGGDIGFATTDVPAQSPSVPVQLGLPGSSFKDIDSAVDGATWVLVWEGYDEINMTADVGIGELDILGSFVMGPIYLSDFPRSNGIGFPAVRWDGQAYSVVWEETDQFGDTTAEFSAVDRNGTVVVPQIQLIPPSGRQPKLAFSLAHGMGLIWQDIVPPLLFYGSNVSATGNLIGSTTQISPGSSTAGDHEGQLSSFVDGFAFGYRSTATVGPNDWGDLYYTPLDGNMDPTSAPIPITLFEDVSKVGNLVWTGACFLWPVKMIGVSDLELFRLTKEGDVLGRHVITQPAAAPGGLFGPRAAFSGNAVGVVWQDGRSADPEVWYEFVPTIGLVFGAGADPAAPAAVRSRSAFAGEALLDFTAYATASYGASVATGNIDPQALDEILTGPGPGPIHGPQVRAFTGIGAAVPKVNFYAYGTLRGGVHVAASDLDDDGMAEILTGAGPQPVFGPHVRGFDYDGTTVRPLGKVSFFAYQTLKYGVEVGGGDVNGDGDGEILTGPGPGAVFGAQLRGFDVTGGSTSAMPNVNTFPFSWRYGLIVAAGDLSADGRDEIIVAGGPDPAATSEVKVLDVPSTPLLLTSVTPFPTAGGAHVASGDMNLDGRYELVVTPGYLSGNAGRSMAFDYASGTLTSMAAWDQVIFPAWPYGASCAIGNLGL